MELLTGFSKRLCFTIILLVLGSSEYCNGKRLALSRKISDSKFQNGTDLDGSRTGKLLPFFAFVKFNQGICQGDAGESGVCMKNSQCTSQGGKNVGSCAMSYGICCMVSKACTPETVVVNTNGTTLTQGATFQEICRYEIPKQPNVCQVRLDFQDFRIDEGPNAEFLGSCSTDTLTISGNSNGMLGPLCGDLSGQHMYLDYGPNDKINLDIFLTMADNQEWKILVTMIKCDSPERAPAGCLQYYTTQRGMVKSFNYNLQHQLNDQDYAVCVRTNPGMKRITWKSCGGVNDFFISGIPPALPLPGVPGDPLYTYENGTACAFDWVMVFGDNKYCGNGFPDGVSSVTQPFMLQVHLNQWELPVPPTLGPPDFTNYGFCLMYSQSPY